MSNFILSLTPTPTPLHSSQLAPVELAGAFEDKCKAGELTTDELIDLRDQLEIEYSKAAQFLKEQVRKAEEENEEF